MEYLTQHKKLLELEKVIKKQIIEIEKMKKVIAQLRETLNSETEEFKKNNPKARKK